MLTKYIPLSIRKISILTMHYYYSITDYNALGIVTNIPRENCSSFVSKEW